MSIPPPCSLSLHILRPVGLLFPLFLPQDTVNTLSDFLCFFHFLFQCKIPLIKRFPLGGQLALNIQLFPYHGLEFFIKPRHSSALVCSFRRYAACRRSCNLSVCAFLRRSPYRKAIPTKGGFPYPHWGV